MNLNDFDELLDGYLLGELSKEQSGQLQGALQTDPASRRRFVESIFIETGLHRLARSEPASLAPRRQRPPEADARRHMTRPRALAAVVLVAVGAIAIFCVINQGPSPLAHVASGSVLVDGQPDHRITEGSTLSVRGQTPAVIDLSDGSRATLDPDTQLTLRGRVDSTRQVLHLTAGGGQFQVPYGGGQFRIDTPAGSVTVLGTQFTAVLRSPRSLFVSVAAGTVRFDGDGKSFTIRTGEGRTFGPEPDRPPPPVTAGIKANDVADGYIHSVDLKAGTFVLGGKNESQTTFRVGAKVGEREAIILLDGKKATFQAAIQPSRKATVTFVTIGRDLWVTNLEVTSATKEPDRPRPADEKEGGK